MRLDVVADAGASADTDAAMPDTAIVLAAGLGKRMRPLTDTVPKPLVPVAGKALLDHGLDALAAAGVARAIVNVHYLADRIEAHVARRTSPRVTISDERERLLDSGGGIARALARTDADTVLLVNADTFWIDGRGTDGNGEPDGGGEPNLRRLARAWDPARMDVLVLLAPLDRAVGHSTGRGDFLRRPDGSLERSPAGDVYAGVAILKRSIFRGDEPEVHSLNLHFDRLIAAGRLHGAVMDGLWLTVGTPDAIGEAESAIAAWRGGG